ncbi:MAG: hypothetical protein JWP87_1950 [Labilithrix sp.]|nr:hypothetical protein [Labilithrix sp.]
MARIAPSFGLLLAIGGISLGVAAGIGCEGDYLAPVDPKCKETKCTCEEDPFQALCKGFNDRPETGPVEFDASRPDVGVGDASDAAAGDGESDADPDAGD